MISSPNKDFTVNYIQMERINWTINTTHGRRLHKGKRESVALANLPGAISARKRHRITGRITDISCLNNQNVIIGYLAVTYHEFDQVSTGLEGGERGDSLVRICQGMRPFSGTVDGP